MSKFKVGDRVKVASDWSMLFEHANGKEGVVKSISGWDDYGIQFNINVDGHDLHGCCPMGYGLWVNEQYLTLVKTKQFTKSDLKPHHIIEDRDGDLVIWENENGYYDNYSDDLKYIINSGSDVMKVYEFETLVWERNESPEEPDYEELTVAEIEKLLNRKIKIVKE